MPPELSIQIFFLLVFVILLFGVFVRKQSARKWLFGTLCAASIINLAYLALVSWKLRDGLLFTDKVSTGKEAFIRAFCDSGYWIIVLLALIPFIILHLVWKFRKNT